MSPRVRRYAFAAIAISVLSEVSIRIGFAHRNIDPRAIECASETHEENAIKQRLKLHPGCPKAHFAYARLLAKQNRIEAARRELKEAERLQPGLSFASEKEVRDLAHKLGIGDQIAHPRIFHF